MMCDVPSMAVFVGNLLIMMITIISATAVVTAFVNQ
jgi:hypothetical protein